MAGSQAFAGTWYVRSGRSCPINGDGTAPSCAASNGAAGAWSGFSSIAWASVQPGETLNLVGGDTYAETLVVGKSGNARQPLTISLSGTGTATIDGGQTRTGINLNGNSYVNINGLFGNAAFGGSTVYGIAVVNIGATEYCVYENNGGHHFKVLHVSCTGTSPGSSQPDDNRGGMFFSNGGGNGGIEVAFNNIFGPDMPLGSNQKWGATCVTMFESTGSSNYNDNLTHDNRCNQVYNDGLRCGSNCSVYHNEVSHVDGSGHSDSLLIQSGSNSAIYNNFVHDSGDQNIYLDNLYDSLCGHVRVYNNVINSNPGFGLVIDAEGGAGAGPAGSGCSQGSSSQWDDIEILNNTFYSTSASNVRDTGRGLVTNLVVENNIFGTVTGNGYHSLDVIGTSTFANSSSWDHNVYSTSSVSYPTVASAFGAFQTTAELQLLNPPRETHAKLGIPTYVNAGADDFHLAGADTIAKGAGINLASAYPFLQLDMEGHFRPSSGAWDAGAFSSATGVRPNPPGNASLAVR